MLLGGPESEPFAKQSSAIHDTRCFKVFMVPDEEYPLATIIGFEELNKKDKGTVLLSWYRIYSCQVYTI